MHKESFNPSQIMRENRFEFHHNYNESPPSVKFHQHPFYEIFFFLSGNVTYIIEGKSYQLHPGDILLTSCLDIHRPNVLPGSPYERIVIWLTEDFFGYLKDSYGEDLASCFTDAARKNYRLIRPEGSDILYLKGLCTQISLAKHSKEIGSASLAFAHLIEFLVHINRTYYNAPASLRCDIIENETVNQMLQYINENLTETISLDRLAARFYTSKYYLSRQFKQFTGLSVYQYIMKKRLVISWRLLRSGSSVMEACLQCGFGDYSNFLKAFKREFGTTPGKFCKR